MIYINIVIILKKILIIQITIIKCDIFDYRNKVGRICFISNSINFQDSFYILNFDYSLNLIYTFRFITAKISY